MADVSCLGVEEGLRYSHFEMQLRASHSGTVSVVGGACCASVMRRSRASL